jgi:hypothetical protein
MRFFLFIAILAAGLLVAGLALSSLMGRANRPQTIHNPYVNQ